MSTSTDKEYTENNPLSYITLIKDDSTPAEPPSYNPTLTESECPTEDLDRLKGDAIGDTLYSERFVLNTLLKLGQLSKDLQEEEDIEKDMCVL